MAIRPLIFTLALLVLTNLALAQSWSEVDDAGELVATAQETMGDGPLTSITGLSDASIEDKDVYAIKILGGGGFSADVSSARLSDGFFDDSKIYLFDSTGLGIIGDDDGSVGGGAFDAGFPLGNSLINGLAEGIYYLAITDNDFIPTSDLGEIFPIGDAVGPTGPGGGSIHSGWSASEHEESWQYTITLTGAEYARTVPEPVAVLVCLAAMSLGWGVQRVRRRSNDS